MGEKSHMERAVALDTFVAWWNRLANRNQKVKFRNSREAAEFVRRMSNTSRPNREVLRMREQYVAVQEAKKKRAA